MFVKTDKVFPFPKNISGGICPLYLADGRKTAVFVTTFYAIIQHKIHRLINIRNPAVQLKKQKTSLAKNKNKTFMKIHTTDLYTNLKLDQSQFNKSPLKDE